MGPFVASNNATSAARSTLGTTDVRPRTGEDHSLNSIASPAPNEDCTRRCAPVPGATGRRYAFCAAARAMISSASVKLSSRLNWTQYPEAPSTASQLHSMKSSPEAEIRRFAGTRLALVPAPEEPVSRWARPESPSRRRRPRTPQA